MLPEHFKNQAVVEKVCELLQMKSSKEVDIAPLAKFTNSLATLKKQVNIAVIGKYVKQVRQDTKVDKQEGSGEKKPVIYLESYKSVHEALCHAGVKNDAQVEVNYFEYDEFNQRNIKDKLSKFDGVLVPGGFGDRGMDDLIHCIKHVRESQIPFFGICLGLQLAVIEFTRNVLKIKGANSEEFDPDCRQRKENVIYLMGRWYEYRTGQMVYRDEQTQKGGTMRLGLKPCLLNPGTKAYDIYRNTFDEANSKENKVYHYPEVPLRQSVEIYRDAFSNLDEASLTKMEKEIKNKNLMTIYERHRHRYEINPDYHESLTKPSAKGNDYFIISGDAPSFSTGGETLPPHIVEIMELKHHPWHVGCQFHPEFLSRPLRPHPLFLGFIKAAIKFQKSRKN